MPFVFTATIHPDGLLGVWKVTEEPGELESRLILDPDDKQILATIRNPNRIRQWLGCRMALSGLLDTPVVGIRYTPFGQPLLASEKGYISFSHSGPLASAIWSRNRLVGIDVEQIGDRLFRVATRFLSPRELAMAPLSGSPELLTLFWAAKETLYKINGNPDLDLQKEINIESFDYLCATRGELVARVEGRFRSQPVKVSFERVDDFIITWAMVPENC